MSLMVKARVLKGVVHLLSLQEGSSGLVSGSTGRFSIKNENQTKTQNAKSELDRATSAQYRVRRHFMSTSIFDNERFDFTCPNCSKHVIEKVGRMKRHGYTCPRCGVALDMKELGRLLDEAKKAWDKFCRDLSRINITIKL